jgi:site-specific recombinase XerC
MERNWPMHFPYAEFIRTLEVERQLSCHTLESYVTSIEKFIKFSRNQSAIRDWKDVDEWTVRQY